MGIKITDSIPNSHKSTTFVCSKCKTQLLSSRWIIPGDFYGSHGKAYFTSRLINYRVPKKSRTRKFLTGVFTVKDVHCKQCSTIVGWKYLESHSSAEKYKENKFVIETALISKGPEEFSVFAYLAQKYFDRLDSENEVSVEDYVEKLNEGVYKTHDYEIEDSDDDLDIVLDTKVAEIPQNLVNVHTIDTSDKLVYRDETHCFEVQKNAIDHYSWSSSYVSDKDNVYDSDEESDDDVYANLTFLGYKSDRGYCEQCSAEFEDEEMEKDEADEEMKHDEDAAAGNNETEPYTLSRLPNFVRSANLSSPVFRFSEMHRMDLRGLPDTHWTSRR